MTAQPRNLPTPYDILGAGAGGPLAQPSAWSQFSGYVQYGGGVVVGAPSGGAQGAGSINAQGLWLNGTQFLPSSFLPLAGGTLTGPLTLSGDPTAAFGAATKQYTDARQWQEAPSDGSSYGRRNAAWNRDPIQTDAPNDGNRYIRQSQGWTLAPLQNDAPSDGTTYGRRNGVWTATLTPATAAATYLPLAGGTLTGALTLAADPTAALQPATKQYTDLRQWQEAPTDGFRYVRISSSWSRDPIQSDAPSDGSLYARSNAGWAAIPSVGPGGTASRTTVGDANYTIQPTDAYVVTSASLTAPRTWTLPLANSVPPGTQLIVEDAAGVATTTNTVSIVRAGTNTINNATAALVLGSGIRQSVILHSDGAANWTYANDAPQRIDGATIGATTPGSGAFTQAGIGAGISANAALNISSSTTAQVAMSVPTNPTDAKTWDFLATAANGGTFYLRTVNDAYNNAANVFYVNRTGWNTPGAVVFPAAAGVQVSGNFTANGPGATVSLTPSGAGTVTIRPATVGTLDNVSIGGNVKSIGQFTNLYSSTISVTSNYAGYLAAFNNTGGANGQGGVIGQVSATYGILGYVTGGSGYSFYGNSLGYFGGGLTCNATLNVSGVSDLQSIVTRASMTFTNVANFAICYNNVAGWTTGSGSVYFYFSGSPYFIWQPNMYYPYQDNYAYLGVSSNRWMYVYAGYGTIQTSDATEKQDIIELEEAELRVATRLKKLVRKYRWIDQVVKEREGGKRAQLHVGILAQDIEKAFRDEGLDADSYAMWCRDELFTYDPPAEGDDKMIAVSTGEHRYGVNYSQVLAFIIAAM